MSRASTLVWRMTSAEGAADAAGAAAASESRSTGAVSRTSRWRVQSPPRVTSDGTPGSGMMLPNLPPPPANVNAVT